MSNLFIDPWFVFPFGIFIILVNLAILYFLKETKPLEDLPNNAEKSDESSIYEKMYGGKPFKTEDFIHQAIETKTRLEKQSIEELSIEKSTFELTGESYKKAVLIQKEGPNPGRQYTIYLGETMIGRSEANDLVLWDNSLNQNHAKIKNIRDRFILFDLVSDKGVWLNGKKLLRPKILTDFDEIRLGKTTLIFRGK